MRKRVFFEGLADVTVDNKQHFSMASRIRYKKVLMGFEKLLRRHGVLTVYGFTLGYLNRRRYGIDFPESCIVKNHVSVFLKNLPTVNAQVRDRIRYVCANIEDANSGPHTHVLVFLEGDSSSRDDTFIQECFQLWGKVTEGKGFFYNGGNYSKWLESNGIKGMLGKVSLDDVEKIKLTCEKIRYNTKDQKTTQSSFIGERGRFFIAYEYRSGVGRVYGSLL